MQLSCFNCCTLCTKSEHLGPGLKVPAFSEALWGEMFLALNINTEFYFLQLILGVEWRHRFAETRRYFLWCCIEENSCKESEFVFLPSEPNSTLSWLNLKTVQTSNISLFGHMLSYGDFLSSLCHQSNLDLNPSWQTPCILERFP